MKADMHERNAKDTAEVVLRAVTWTHTEKISELHRQSEGEVGNIDSFGEAQNRIPKVRVRAKIMKPYCKRNKSVSSKCG